MSKPVQDLIRLLCASALILVVTAVLNLIVDPLQLFRPARLLPAMYSQDNRLQNAGLIRSQPFDTVFMGTSLAIHFRQSDIDRVLGVRSLKLAMPGSNSKEQNFVLAAAIDRHPGRVIWQMDDWIFVDTPDIDANANLPADLYRGNAKGIASYLFSAAMARESVWILARSIGPLQTMVARLTSDVLFTFFITRVDDINALRPDIEISEAYNAKKAMAAFRRIIDPIRSEYLAVGIDYDAMVRNFERDAVGLIANNPDVRFDIYLTPYSILHFVAMREASPATLKIVYDFSAYASRRLTAFSNVSLHDFRTAKQITHDLANYGDVIHHSPAIDLKVLSMLADETYLVDRSGPTAALDRLKAQVDAYRVGDMER
jgi:hypothetical protein